jgi:hypothetical protein
MNKPETQVTLDTRHRTKKNKTRSTTLKTKNVSNTDPTKNNGGKPRVREVSSSRFL